jgi:hypothetical protein
MEFVFVALASGRNPRRILVTYNISVYLRGGGVTVRSDYAQSSNRERMQLLIAKQG